MRVKTAEMTAESLRETGVARMGLLRKLYEKSEVRVLEYPPIWQDSQVVRRQPAKLRIVSSTLTLASKSSQLTSHRNSLCARGIVRGKQLGIWG